jgi:D-mannose binding lectin
MNTNNIKLGSIRRGLTRSLRTALIPLAMAGAAATSTFVAEREASAEIISSVASMFVKNAVTCLATGNTKNFGKCLLVGETSSYSLSSSDLASIKEIVSEELDAHSLTELSAQSDGVISDATEYYRNETQTISALQQSYAWAESIHDDAEDVMDTLLAYGLDGAEGYKVLGAIRHAMLVEMYNIEVAKNALGVAAGSGEYLLNASDLATFRTNRIQSEANEVAVNLSGFSDDVDTAFGSLSHYKSYSGNKLSKGSCYVFLLDLGYYQNVTSKYCYSDPTSSSGTTCHTYSYWQCSYRSGDNYNSESDHKAKATANIAYQTAKMDYRDDMLGELVFETIDTFEKAADGDFEYCGNGTCSVGEIDNCSADCTDTNSTTGTFDQVTSYGSWGVSSTTSLLTNDDATLKWQSDGNLVLYATNGKVIWSSRTYGNSATSLVFQNDGNLAIYSNSTYLWGSQTTTTDGVTTATKLVLAGEVLHLLDADDQSVWNSETDWNRHSDGYDAEDSSGGRFCIDNSVAKTLLKNGDRLGWYKYKLDWQTDGNLVLYSGTGATPWQTYTGGSGEYLCNQEDGNLVIYDDEYNALWSSGTSSRGVGGQLQLMRDQVRLTTDSGDLLWVSGECSSDDCKYAARSSSSFSLTKGTSSQTILETGKAKFVYNSGGYLQILDKTTGSALWTSSVSGTTASFSSGTLKVGTTSINSTAGSKLFLADCNLFIGDSSTNKSVYSTGTKCD